MWDPEHYLRFADHRTRPGLELLARIPDVDPATVVDLGAGTGHLSALLARRWPRARVTGIDGDPAMIERGRAEQPGLEWVAADLTTWEPDGLLDVIYSNAALHWLDGHDTLFPRLRSWLAPGGVLAVQMPDNWAAPTHTIPAQILDGGIPDGGDWPDEARRALLRDRLASPEAYAHWLGPATLDIWRTTYHQRLTGDDPVWQWVTGSLLLPVLDALGPNHSSCFTAEVQARYRQAYPPGPGAVTTLPFSRLFLVAQAP